MRRASVRFLNYSAARVCLSCCVQSLSSVEEKMASLRFFVLSLFAALLLAVDAVVIDLNEDNFDQVQILRKRFH